MRFRKDADDRRREAFERALNEGASEPALEELAKSAKVRKGDLTYEVFVFTHPIPIIRRQEAEWFAAAIMNCGVWSKIVDGDEGITLQVSVLEWLDVEIIYRKDFGDDACKSGLARHWFGGKMPPDPRERDIEEDTMRALKNVVVE